MKAMKKEKLFTRNFTLLILGQVSSLTGNYTSSLPCRCMCWSRPARPPSFAGMLSAAAAGPPFCSRLRQDPCRQGQPQTHHGGVGRPVRLIGTGGGAGCCRWGGSFG